MHGRVKVRTTAEQEALKKKERAEKLARYTAGMSITFEKKKDNVYDDELMMVTERILLQNPDIYTLWNIRREAFLNAFEEDKEWYRNELTLTENCLKQNPKSYWVWYQRIWIMSRLTDCDWKKELTLCAKCLNLDERNYQRTVFETFRTSKSRVKNRRAFVVQKAGISLEEEFDFSTSKIQNNFSNYSSWHYRSQLLTEMFHRLDQKDVEEKKKEELDLVRNATFTDPNDSSAWFYQRWLLDAHENIHTLSQILIRESNVVLFANKNLFAESLCLRVNNEPENVEWKSWRQTKTSKLWFGKLEKHPDEIENIAVEVEGTVHDLLCLNQKWIYRNREHSSRRCHNKEQLAEQLSNYKQLMEMEPNNKWAHLTSILLMRKIDFTKYYEDILANLNVLISIDYLRANYYKDLRSRYVIEKKLAWNASEDQEMIYEPKIDLSGLDLTTLNNGERLSFYEEINLGANLLSRALPQLSFMQICRKLSLSSNRLESLEKFPALQNLEVLSLRNNNVNNLEDISKLIRRHKLKMLDLRENPICRNKELRICVQEIDPDLQLLVDEVS